MTEYVINLEKQMWQAALAGDKDAFCRLVADDAVMVCGGFRCSGAEYAGFIENFGISSYEITFHEVVCETDDSVQLHYVLLTTTDSPENADLAGLFHVTSTWKRIGDEWQLIFNMDSRIFAD